jgi:hypothetical protein
MTRSGYTSVYPIFKTVRCAGCGCLVEVRMDRKEQKGKVFCGRPCASTKHRNSVRPTIIKVHKPEARRNEEEYVVALRKHLGLPEVWKPFKEGDLG